MSETTDKQRLDWLDSHQFTAYRDRDPEHGKLSDHATVVDESAPGSRRGHTGTIREAIDSAMAAERSTLAGKAFNAKGLR